MPDDQNSNPVVEFSEKKIVGKLSEIHASVAAESLTDKVRILGHFENCAPKLGVKIVCECEACNILIVPHDRVDFGKDARVKLDLHLGCLSEIFRSNSSRERAIDGLASSSESLLSASASPPSDSENNAGRESRI